jgi:hypothetical protein
MAKLGCGKNLVQRLMPSEGGVERGGYEVVEGQDGGRTSVRHLRCLYEGLREYTFRSSLSVSPNVITNTDTRTAADVHEVRGRGRVEGGQVQIARARMVKRGGRVGLDGENV